MSEPEVLLLSGRRVTEALYEMVSGLIAGGHTILVDPVGHVTVTPECDPDLLWCLGASYTQTEAVLEELLRNARHGPLMQTDLIAGASCVVGSGIRRLARLATVQRDRDCLATELLRRSRLCLTSRQRHAPDFAAVRTTNVEHVIGA